LKLLSKLIFSQRSAAPLKVPPGARGPPSCYATGLAIKMMGLYSDQGRTHGGVWG